MSTTIVGDFDFETDGIAFFGSRVAAGQRFNGDQVGTAFDVNGLYQVITGSRWIVLITGCGGGCVGNLIATLTDIDRTGQCDRRRGSIV